VSVLRFALPFFLLRVRFGFGDSCFADYIGKSLLFLFPPGFAVTFFFGLISANRNYLVKAETRFGSYSKSISPSR
jgi:hypothetical protein